ncbi:MAG: hypothetical protein KHY26_11680, partial [Faecalibacterium prausnitzii]|nr:hypothetical protein [Faecalibacterium prausnitzii]
LHYLNGRYRFQYGLFWPLDTCFLDFAPVWGEKTTFSFCRNRVGPEFLTTPPLYVENFSIIVPKTKSRHTMRKCTIYWLISF